VFAGLNGQLTARREKIVWVKGIFAEDLQRFLVIGDSVKGQRRFRARRPRFAAWMTSRMPFLLRAVMSGGSANASENEGRLWRNGFARAEAVRQNMKLVEWSGDGCLRRIGLEA